MRTIKMRMVNGTANNNKFYDILFHDDGSVTAHWGRVGTNGQTAPLDDWEKKYREKLRKGYRDVTDLQQEESNVEVKSNIEDKDVADLIAKLSSYSNDFIKNNYRISANSVTRAQVEEVQNCIATMKGIAEKYAKSELKNERYAVESFNWGIEEILTTIPRVVVKVKDLLAKSPKDFNDILEREQSILNVMAAKVKAHEVEIDGKGMLEAHGLEIRPVTAKEKESILSHLDNSTRQRFVRAFRVVNKNTEDRFDKFCKDNDYGEKDIHFNYHGSRNRNWLGILQNGLCLNPKAPTTGHMFSAPGCGIYTATSSAKSANYASLRDCYWNNEAMDRGYLAVFKVAMKNPHHVYRFTSDCSSLTQKHMDRMGCDGTFAHKGPSLHADEIIVYREEQMTIRYLIEIK